MRLEGLTEQEILERALFLEELTARGMRQAVRAVTAELDAETVVLTAASLPGSGVWRALQAMFGVWRRFVNDNVMPYLTQEWRDAGARIAEEIRVEWPDWELPNRGGDLPFESLRHAENHMVGLSTELWENARAALTEGFEAGESVQQLAVRVRGAVDVTEARARAAARTELARAANAGTYDTIVAAGFTGRKEWVATEDSRTRPDHAEADGQRVPIGGMFAVGGNLARYPADRMLPPGEAINCRCVAVYDVDDEAIVASLQQFHLPGKHDQKSHGNRKGKVKAPSKGLGRALGKDPVKPPDFRDISPADAIEEYGYTDPTTETGDALYAYSTEFGYQTINDKLRGLPERQYSEDFTSEQVDNVVPLIDGAMRTFADDINLYRRTSPRSFGMKYDDDPGTMVGKTFQDLGYMSTTVNPANSALDGFVHLTIKAPRGAKGVYIERVSEFPFEQEMLLARGSRYRIVSAKKEDVEWRLVAEIVVGR